MKMPESLGVLGMKMPESERNMMKNLVAKVGLQPIKVGAFWIGTIWGNTMRTLAILASVAVVSFATSAFAEGDAAQGKRQFAPLLSGVACMSVLQGKP